MSHEQTTDPIDLDTFNADSSASGQPLVQAAEALSGDHQTANPAASLSNSMSSFHAFQPPNNLPIDFGDPSRLGYNPTFGYYPLTPTVRG